MEEKWLSLNEASQHWGLERRTIWNAVTRGHLTARKVPRPDGGRGRNFQWEVLATSPDWVHSCRGRRAEQLETYRYDYSLIYPYVVAYCAGIIDGEGCISSANAGQSRTRVIRVIMGNTFEGIVDFFISVFGGMKQKRKIKRMGRPCYVWSVSSLRAQVVLEVLRPYLIIKRAQAEVALKMRALRAGPMLAVTDHEEHNKLIAELTALNKRHPMEPKTDGENLPSPDLKGGE